MSLLTNRKTQLANALRKKSYRDAYVGQHIKRGIAFQLKALREDRGWTQSELGKRAGKKQSFISALENPDTNGYTLNTLQEMAATYDVALIVRFVPFSQLVEYTSQISPADLAPPRFDDDQDIKRTLSDHIPSSTANANRNGITVVEQYEDTYATIPGMPNSSAPV